MIQNCINTGCFKKKKYLQFVDPIVRLVSNFFPECFTYHFLNVLNRLDNSKIYKLIICYERTTHICKTFTFEKNIRKKENLKHAKYSLF